MSLISMLGEILRGLPETVLLTLAAFIAASVLGIPLMLLRLSRHWLPRLIATSLIMAIRGLPPIVWLFIVFFGLGSGYIKISPITAAIVTLAIFYSAYLAETYRGGIAAIPRGQWEAANALALPRAQTAISIIGPQVFRIVMPSMATYAIALMKDTSLASTIGVMELAYWGNHVANTTFRDLDFYAIVGILYIIISLPVAALSRVADKQLRRKVAL